MALEYMRIDSHEAKTHSQKQEITERMPRANCNCTGYTNKPKHCQNALQFSKRNLKSDVAIGLKVLQLTTKWI